MYSLLCPEIDKVGPHGVLLTAAELVHAEGGGHVLVSHLVPHPPPHVHHLVLQPVLLPAVLLDLRVDVLHQGVPLHQHVGEGGAGEDPHNLQDKFHLLLTGKLSNNFFFGCFIEKNRNNRYLLFLYLRTEGRKIVKVAGENSVNSFLVPRHAESYSGLGYLTDLWCH